LTPIKLEHASRLINHGPTVLVCAEHQGRRNLMAAAWSMPVEFTPPRIAVVIDKSTHTAELVRRSGMLGLCVPPRALVDLTTTVGQVTGHGIAAPEDKFARYGIAFEPGPVLGMPLVVGSVACMEARVIDTDATRTTQSAYDTWFVEVVHAAADERVFAQGRWSFRDDNAPLHTLHHLGGGVYSVSAVTVTGQQLKPITAA
jgi:flavin reductase (DIM6/NTAB) family NADH-FMN oxidoreductase RutF